MFPEISVSFLDHTFTVRTYEALTYLSIFASIIIFALGLPSWKRVWKAPVLVLGISIGSLIGGRLFHVLWERPSLLQTPDLIFTRWDGLVFYGGLMMGVATLWILNLLLFRREERSNVWSLAAIASAVSFSMLKIGCFSVGCCWGHLTDMTWAVKFPYDPHSLMPLTGLPVHPVQLYDSLIGFGISTILIVLYVKNRKIAHSKSLFPTFCGLYAAMRLFTEHFRADSFRGDHVLLNLSTSQIISVAILGIVAWPLVQNYLEFVKLKRLVSRLAMAILCFTLSGCILPDSPSSNLFLSRHLIRDGFEAYVSNQDRLTFAKSEKRGNAIFLTADSYLAKNLLNSGGDSLPSIDDLTWYEYAPVLTQLYARIIRITVKEAKRATLLAAIKEMEQSGENYDVYILSHGAPNHLSDGDGYFFSYKELASLKNKLPHLNLVFMQSCFGRSLSRDWLGAGAKKVISFEEFNRNFFWIGFFIGIYRFSSIEHAFNTTNLNIGSYLKGDLRYLKLFDYLQLDPDEYVSHATNPWLDSK